MKRLGHAVIVLGIAVCLVGAATAARGDGEDEAGPRSAVLPVVPDLGPAVADPGVPIRSASLDQLNEEAPVRPVAVRLAGIAVEAPVLPVGVDANNQFAVPAADTVGWYQHSSSPGAPGASVLAAHVDYGGRPGAFFDLAKLQPGDGIEVEMEDGSVQLYQVTATHSYDKSELPATELFRKDGEPVLQLITCGGTFDPVAKSYEANVVVTAEPLET